MDVKFLGVGSAFSYKDDCNSCYWKEGTTIYFIDMGEKIASKIIDKGLLNDVTSVNIFITHMHADHIGSLEPLLTYIRVFTKISDVTVIYPNREPLEAFIKMLNYKGEVNWIEDDAFNLNGLHIEVIPQYHIANSYGYVIKGKEDGFFYSGDTSVLSLDALDLLKGGIINRIYHEVSSKSSPMHIGIDDLARLVPDSLRSKFILMHFESETLKEKCASLGFKIAQES
ncbi:MAG: MBL fold metallo-hydrolase [Bacilli bacterium]|nr:MBL fold metallo-hydrolase [Bacilli bacterium]